VSSTAFKTVLLVDDEHGVLNATARILERGGYRVSAVANALEAVHVFETTPIDALVTDIALGGVSGMDLAGRLRQVAPDLPVIFIGLDPVRRTGCL
jgi:DNA-binding NtrC family response regulator